MSANTTPKFWFEVDGRKFGGRFLTIAEQAQAQVEVERLTNGHFGVWLSSDNVVLANTAILSQMAVTLNRAIVAWPTDLPAFDFLDSDDNELIMKLWEAYGKSADDFRQPSVARETSEVVG
jgi:hypothetical protein